MAKVIQDEQAETVWRLKVEDLLELQAKQDQKDANYLKRTRGEDAAKTLAIVDTSDLPSDVISQLPLPAAVEVAARERGVEQFQKNLL
jgi:hypothetical protein